MKAKLRIVGVVIIFLLAGSLALPVQAGPPDDPASFEIGLQSRQFTPEPGMTPEVRSVLENKGKMALAQGAARLHTVLQLDYIPTPDQAETLRQRGIKLLTYIPNYAWLASIPAADPTQIIKVAGVRWVGTLTVQDKLQPELQAQAPVPWAYDAANDRIALLVQFYKDVNLARGRALVEAHSGEVVGEVGVINTLVVHINRAEVKDLAAEDEVEWIEQPLPALEPTNDGVRARIGVDTLYNAPYSLRGTNVDVLVYDGGTVATTHSAFAGRLTIGDTSVTVDHATHVAGTVGGNGAGSPPGRNLRGMAPSADIISYGFEGNGTGVFLYTDPGDIQADWNAAKNTYGADLGTASLGTNTAANGFPCSFEGNYGATDQLMDAIVRGSLGEPYIATWANGNERSSGRCGTTYRTTAPPADAKNPIHVGATNSDNDTMTSFSSWGPTDDGRIKPTISAPGCEAGGEGAIWSTLPPNTYGGTGWCGTSMAAPAVAGTVALMLQQYRTTYSTSGEFLPSTAKALLMHTAVDLGNTGPDYQFGYGRINAVAAVDAIIARNFREETITAHGQVDQYTIAVSGSPAQLKVSLAWDDPAGSLAAIKKLVNDLDLELQAPNGTIYRPWVLNPASPANAATSGVDSLNNQEQVVVNNPLNGTWIVRVKGTTVPVAPQAYSIVFNGASTAPKSTTPGGGPPPPPATTCSEVLTNGGFETGTTPWMWSGSATRSSISAHGGTYSGRVGSDTADGYFYQQVVLPTTFYSGTLTYWIRMNTGESGMYDYFDAEVRDGSDNILTTLQTLASNDSSYQNVWRQQTFTLGSEYANRTIRLRFGADVDGSVSTYWYVDDASLNACLTGNTPPTIDGLPDQELQINTSWDNAIDLWAYASDAQTPDSGLTFTIDNAPNPDAGVTIDSNRYIDIFPSPGWTGSTDVTIKVTDPGSLFDTDTFLVNVMDQPPPPGDVYLPVILQNYDPAALVVLTAQNFEGSFPGPWQVSDNSSSDGGEYYWGKRTCRPYDGAYSGWAVGGGAQGGALACSSSYRNYNFSWMIYGPFDLTGATDAGLDFYFWANTELGYDVLFWGASIDGDNFYGTGVTGNWTSWNYRRFSLRSVPTLGNLVGRNAVWVAFIFDADFSITYPEGAYVDDIVLWKYLSGIRPTGLDVTGEMAATSESRTAQEAMFNLHVPAVDRPK